LPDGAAIRALQSPALIDTKYAETNVRPSKGAGRPDGSVAQERLLYAGFDAVLTEADAPNSGSTRLFVSATTSPEVRERVVAALGLRREAVVPWDESQATPAFRLEVGDDYDPCFDPSAP
jgi:hypothetical protein